MEGDKILFDLNHFIYALVANSHDIFKRKRKKLKKKIIN